jgi:hypothetical protein
MGAVMLVAGIRNTYADLWNLVRNDFTSQGGFISWIAAIAVVGAMGYIPKLKPLSIAFMTLLLIVLVISNGGVFAKLTSFIQSGAGGRNAPPITPTPPLRGSIDPLAELNHNLGNIP